MEQQKIKIPTEFDFFTHYKSCNTVYGYYII